MGLIKAAAGAAGGVLADQWKEFFTCEALPANVLAVKGQKKTTRRSSNTHGDENIITTGSRIAVADGQCMLIVEQGKVVEVCAEPGEYTYDASTEPSIFAGNLGESIGQVFRNIGKRFTFGGEAPKDQRIYYFNTKELTGNKYGTPSPVPFRVVDQRAGIDIDIGIRCFGEYSYHIANPLLFYTNVCGNVTEDYTRDTLDSQLKSELLTALQPAFARISDMGIRYSALPGHTREIAGRCDEGGRVQHGHRPGHGVHGHGHGRPGGRRQRAGPLCHGPAAGGTAARRPGGRELDVRLRPDGQHRQVLRQLRPAAPGRAGGLDVRVRRGEQGQVLLRVRPPETGRHTEIQVRQMRLGAGRPDPPAEILPRVRRPV
mgnify:CR=1 FL=1